MEHVVFDPRLTQPDLLVLQNLAADISQHVSQNNSKPDGQKLNGRKPSAKELDVSDDDATIAALTALNDPKDPGFQPTIFNAVELEHLKLPPLLDTWLFRPCVRIARSVVRVETDIVMFMNLVLYFTTSVPSAIILFWRFSWIHAVLHFVMQVSYIGTYTLMMHQHIHMRGILNKRFAFFDTIFPYITDPLMGHTWNSYFYHHVKHHHLEANGPDDLSSTIRYQRDDVFHLLHYVGRFYFFIWLELPLYFFRRGKPLFAAKAAFWELSSYAVIYSFYRLNPRATFFVLILPLLLLRLGLMIGNWGQHAFVDDQEPDSDYRSSITLIDVQSNRFCFNDGYHTSHHLNPMRHWREHPVAFLKGKKQYASQDALVFHNIDYIMITIRLMLKDYDTLAKCMVPIGNQISMTLEERAALLRKHTMKFSEEQIRQKFNQK